MKKYLLLVVLALLGASTSRADLMWYEGYTNYADGSITNNSTNLWSRHSGSASPSDAIVSNHIEQVFANIRQDDVHRLFPAAYTNGSPIPVFASFTMIVTNLPNATGGYFAHFTDNTSSDFFARIFALTGTAGVAGTNFTALSNTFRLGISAIGAAPNVIFPRDLAMNTPYQVVVEYDTVNLDASLWVNPLTQSDPSVTSGDAVTVALNAKVMQAYAFRQATGMGNFAALITNLATATTWSDAATNIATTNTPVAPVILIPPVGFTNFVGSANSLSVVANGQGLANLTYSWTKGGGAISNPNGNSNVFSFASAQTTDSGSYAVVVTTPFGLSITSAPVSVLVSAAPVPPTITSQPASTNAYTNQTVIFSVGYTSPGNVSFQWKSNGVNIVGANSQTYTLNNVTTNFSATYTVGLTNDVLPSTGVVSSNAVLTVLVPPVATINFIRGQVDSVFFLPTNTTAYYTTTGTVISKTNFTTAANDECFIDDGTGGISVFVGGGATFRPNFGDVVTVTGPVSGAFNSLMEFNLSATDPSQSATIVSTGNLGPVPAAVVPLTFTNSAAYGFTSNALRTLGGRLLMLTNVSITPNGGTFTANGTYTLTDTNGFTLTLFIYSGFSNIIGTTVPPFAYTLTGVASEFLGATVADRSSGYQMETSDPADIVTAPPTAVTLSANGSHVISWTAVPYSYAYTIYSSTSVTGPYSILKSGMVFQTSSGSYTDTNTAPTAKFYRVSSP